MYQKIVKRIFDFFIALMLLVLTLPITLITGFILFFTNRGSVFFVQDRPGQHERIFKIIKFKTMNDRRDAKGDLLPDEIRLTKVGNLVRKTSIDELPQLTNVLRGDMSIVGPRPLLCEYLQLYDEVQRRRHNVKPGITGWAQINGRNAIGWESKFDYDIYYVNNLSFRLDLLIIWKTILKVFKSEGISSEGVATMEKFKGN